MGVGHLAEGLLGLGPRPPRVPQGEQRLRRVPVGAPVAAEHEAEPRAKPGGDALAHGPGGGEGQLDVDVVKRGLVIVELVWTTSNGPILHVLVRMNSFDESNTSKG